jgi:transcriptional regulator with GAF, ATPase, and Fis domain
VAEQGAETAVDSRKDTEREARERTDFELLVSRLATQLIAPAPEAVERRVADALSAVGAFAQADRAFLYRSAEGGAAYTLTAEYAAQGLTLLRDADVFRRLPVGMLPRSVLEQLSRSELVMLPQTRGLFGGPLQEAVDAKPGRGILLLPIRTGEELFGFVGLASSRRESQWPTWQIDLVRILAEGFMRALDRERLDAQREALIAQERAARIEAEIASTLITNVVERSGDPFLAIDTEDRVVFLNRQMADRWMKSPEQVLGKRWQENTVPATIPPVEAAIAQAQREQRPVTIEQYLPVTGRWWSIQLFPSAKGTSALFIDITNRRQTEGARDYLVEEIRAAHDPDGIVGEGMAPVLQKVMMVGPSSATVLITGETGTGKELVARAIHNASPRRDRMLVKVNCAAVSAGLVESELFGHERGAFTGAIAKRMGRFEVADSGTLFLDEVGELPLETQAKLLRVLQEGELERVGNSVPIKVDVRVVAATNRDLKAEVAAGRFRSDLLFRLNVFPIEVPPLRERKADIPDLAEVFLKQEARKLGKGSLKLSREAVQRLVEYRWPGNVRELQNVIARCCIVAGTPVVTLADLDAFTMSDGPTTPAPAAAAPSLGTTPLKALEREAMLRALEASNWVLEGARGAAAKLGLHPNTLRARLKRFGLRRPAKTS